MNCFECAIGGKTVAAVATCRHCRVGLCLDHLRQQQAYRVGGTVFGCPHNLSVTPQPAQPGDAASTNRARKLVAS